MSTEYQAIGNPPAGSIRFNTDSSKMEIYNGEAWWEIDATSPFLQTGGTRGLFGGGETPSLTDRIDFINVDTTCLLYTSPSPRDKRQSRMPSSA